MKQAKAYHGALLEHERVYRELQIIQTQKPLAEKRNREVLDSAQRSFDQLEMLRRSRQQFPLQRQSTRKPMYTDPRTCITTPSISHLSASRSERTLNTYTQSISINGSSGLSTKRPSRLNMELIDCKPDGNRQSDAYPLSTRSSARSPDEIFKALSLYTPKTTVSRGSANPRKEFYFAEPEKSRRVADILEEGSDKEASENFEVYKSSKLPSQNASSPSSIEDRSGAEIVIDSEYNRAPLPAAIHTPQKTDTKSDQQTVPLTITIEDDESQPKFIRGRFHRSPTFGHAMIQTKETFFPVPKPLGLERTSSKSMKLVEVKSPEHIKDLARPPSSESFGSSQGFDSSPSLEFPYHTVD